VCACVRGYVCACAYKCTYTPAAATAAALPAGSVAHWGAAGSYVHVRTSAPTHLLLLLLQPYLMAVFRTEADVVAGSAAVARSAVVAQFAAEAGSVVVVDDPPHPGGVAGAPLICAWTQTSRWAQCSAASPQLPCASWPPVCECVCMCMCVFVCVFWGGRGGTCTCVGVWVYVCVCVSGGVRLCVCECMWVGGVRLCV
jgi:hypothetical protein